jgi:hypothetical protein
MRWSEISCFSMLLALALALSAGSGLAQSKPRTKEHKTAATVGAAATNEQNQQPQVPLATLEASRTAFLDALRSMQNQQEAEAKQTRADNEAFLSPLRIQKGLLLIGIIYTVFACFQWWSIRRQANIANTSLAQLKRQVEVQEHSVFRAQSALMFVRDAEADDAAGTMKVVLHNYGTTPANIFEVSLQSCVLRAFPDEPKYAERPRKYTAGMPLLQQDDKDFTCKIEQEEGGQFPLTYGYIIFEDLFDRRFKLGFGILKTDTGFARIPRQSFNYLKRLDEEVS